MEIHSPSLRFQEKPNQMQIVIESTELENIVGKVVFKHFPQLKETLAKAVNTKEFVASAENSVKELIAKEVEKALMAATEEGGVLHEAAEESDKVVQPKNDPSSKKKNLYPLFPFPDENYHKN